MFSEEHPYLEPAEDFNTPVITGTGTYPEDCGCKAGFNDSRVHTDYRWPQSRQAIEPFPCLPSSVLAVLGSGCSAVYVFPAVGLPVTPGEGEREVSGIGMAENPASENGRRGFFARGRQMALIGVLKWFSLVVKPTSY